MARNVLRPCLTLLLCVALVSAKGGGRGGGSRGGGSKSGSKSGGSSGSKAGGSGSSYPKQQWETKSKDSSGPSAPPAPPRNPGYPSGGPPSYPSGPPSYPSYPGGPPSYPSYPGGPPSYPSGGGSPGYPRNPGYPPAYQPPGHGYPSPPGYPGYPSPSAPHMPSYPVGGPIPPPHMKPHKTGGGGLGTHLAAGAAGMAIGAIAAHHMRPRIKVNMVTGHRYYDFDSSEEYYDPYTGRRGHGYQGQGRDRRPYRPGEEVYEEETEEEKKLRAMTKLMNAICETTNQPVVCKLLKMQGAGPFVFENSMFTSGLGSNSTNSDYPRVFYPGAPPDMNYTMMLNYTNMTFPEAYPQGYPPVPAMLTSLPTEGSNTTTNGTSEAPQ